MKLQSGDLPSGVVWTCLWVLLAVVLLHQVLTFGRREKGLPPGPPTIPVLGNAHLIPARGLCFKFKEWAEQYGSVYSLKIGKSTMIVLNDRHAVHELLSMRGAHYNDRPADEQTRLALREENIALTHEGPRWRAERKVAGSYFSPKHLDTALKAVQEAEIGRLMYDLLEKPEEFQTSVKRSTASIGTIIIYGHRAVGWEDFWAYSVYITMERISKALEPGSYLPVEQFPFLKLIPDRWCASRKRAKDFYDEMTGIWNEARERVEQRRARGERRESLIDRLLDEKVKLDEPLTYPQFNNYLGGLQMGAADTTATATLTNILFLGKHPEVQQKAQVELDRVCGTARMPDWSDFKDLPYINCILKEGLRLRPIIPAGIPHGSKQDRWYNGMLIPADSTIFIPAYALNHDGNHYDSPLTYNPDRFLAQADKTAPELATSSKYDERDHYSYGAGRRMCVGIHLAERTQWRILAQMLWAFKIERDVGPDGELAELDTSFNNYEEGFLYAPKDCKVRFVPRSEKHVEVVRRTFGETEAFLRQWE
ncbi:cytochrome P450 2D18 [Colletotrichum sojae]|uniref:Cytochrome P450 2D18 n=1 Tax=Colletotrichum sojae TaxID=2175907 RepID=A0A8H6IPF7_9PEZI|nr:cytochrome P450 2D18 [Colletotrichum sojae]